MNSHVVADQGAVFAFLGDPATHGLSEPVKRIDTHGAAVFLAGADVYKVKRAVQFSYMDFSTLAKRRAACEAEMAVNRPNAPALYLGVLPITRTGDRLHLGGDGEVVEWAVHLRRFDENATLDHVAARGPLGAALVSELAQAIVAAHRRAPRRDGGMATIPLQRALRETTDELGEDADIFAASSIERLRSSLPAAFARAEPLLRGRGASGEVRRCHGDLHLRNIVLVDGRPVLFDAIEFDESIATIDILYDLAFLIMDLCERGLAPMRTGCSIIIFGPPTTSPGRSKALRCCPCSWPARGRSREGRGTQPGSIPRCPGPLPKRADMRSGAAIS